MDDEKIPGIVAWLWTPSTGLRRVACALCASVVLIACALLLWGCTVTSVTPAGGGAFGYELHDPEHITGAGWAGVTIHFDWPLGHKMPGEK